MSVLLVRTKMTESRRHAKSATLARTARRAPQLRFRALRALSAASPALALQRIAWCARQAQPAARARRSQQSVTRARMPRHLDRRPARCAFLASFSPRATRPAVFPAPTMTWEYTVQDTAPPLLLHVLQAPSQMQLGSSTASNALRSARDSTHRLARRSQNHARRAASPALGGLPMITTRFRAASPSWWTRARRVSTRRLTLFRLIWMWT